MENQLNILSESLDQKIAILEQIQKCSEQQEQAFSTEEADLESFDALVDEKDQLIDNLTRLDDGFETLYDNISQELQGNRGKYAAKIRQLQEKITRVTELGVSVQAQEARNKKLVESYFKKARSGIRQNKQSSQAAYNYYKNMSGVAYSASRFVDDKH